MNNEHIISVNMSSKINKNSTPERRWSLIIVSVAIIFILLVTAAGICVHFLVGGNLAKIILLALIGLLILVGALSFAFLQCFWVRELKRRERVIVNYQQRQRMFNTTAPQMSNKTSWAYSAPWRSNTTTLEA